METIFQPMDPMDLRFAVLRLPGVLRKFLEQNHDLFVAGGYLRSIVSGEAVSDIDVFAPSSASASTAVEALRAQMALQGGMRPLRQAIRTRNAITVPYKPDIQFIHRWVFQTPQECLESFDFTVSCAAIFYDGKGWHGIVDPRFYQDIAARRLVYRMPERHEDAGGSMLRVLKFYQRGYRIPLDCLASVIARLVHGVNLSKLEAAGGISGTAWGDERALSGVLTGLLVEVDPSTALHNPSILDSTTRTVQVEEADVEPVTEPAAGQLSVQGGQILEEETAAI